jgi:hypothetical protein
MIVGASLLSVCIFIFLISVFMDFVQLIKSNLWCSGGMSGVEGTYNKFTCTYGWYWAMFGFDALVTLFFAVSVILTWLFTAKWWPKPVQVNLESSENESFNSI